MTQHQINKIIFDYGGVISTQSRREFVINKLALDYKCDYMQLNLFFNSNLFHNYSLGNISSELFFEQLQSKISGSSVSHIKSIFQEASTPNYKMDLLLSKLSKSYQLILISDSIEPFSNYIENKYERLFHSMYFSNVFHARKVGNKLFEEAIKVDPTLFNKSIFIDDNPKNLTWPNLNGSITILFESPDKLLHELKLHGIVV